MSRFFRKFFLLFLQVTIGILIGYYLIHNQELFKSNQSTVNRWNIKQSKNNIWEKNLDLSPNVRIVNLTERSKRKFSCIKTKQILPNLSTNLCLYKRDRDVYVSGTYHDSNNIFEEQQVIRILQYLIRHPHLHFIDLGANIGTYTMFVASLGRFVLAIDCFFPNFIRLRRAIQLANVADRVVLVQNAIYNRSGEDLKLAFDKINVGGQGIVASPKYWWEDLEQSYTSTKKSFTVKTITFNEVLPILVKHGIRSAVIKMDIEGSESFVAQNGNEVFDAVDIPVVQMEWFQIKIYPDRVKIILEFFLKLHYDPVNEFCLVLDVNEFEQWPNDIYWLKKNAPSFC